MSSYECKHCGCLVPGNHFVGCQWSKEPEHHYVALLDCGHYFELTKSWNDIIDTDWPENPKTAFCRRCSNEGRPRLSLMRDVVKFAKVDNDE